MLRIFGYLMLSHSIHSFPMKMIFVLLWFLFTCRPRFTICAVITLILCPWLMSMLLTSGSLEKWNLCESDKCLDDLIWNSFNRNCLIIIGIFTTLTLTDTGHWIIHLTGIQSNSSEFVTYNLPFSPGGEGGHFLRVRSFSLLLTKIAWWIIYQLVFSWLLCTR